jgi:dienelactone hydrolase
MKSIFVHLAKHSLVALIAIAISAIMLRAARTWPPTGKYDFTSWDGPQLSVFFSVPPQADADSPILIVIPGIKRNAEEYRDEWDHLATANRFITLVVEASKKRFPTEYEYNLGGVIDGEGKVQPEGRWLLSAIDSIYDDFKAQYGSHRDKYELYGHSAGGGFAHLFSLLKPNAKVDRVVAANPAFFTMPTNESNFPFGIKGVPLHDNAIPTWFDKRLVILLGDRDREPRTQLLSNGPEARLQGPHVFARGLGFYRAALCEAADKKLDLHWHLEVIPGVGHSNPDIAPYAIKYLFPDRVGL